jgi:trimeric autotransporter adhesin
MTRTSHLMPIMMVGAITAFTAPAYGGYLNIYVQQDTSANNISGGFDANAGDGGVQNTAFGIDALASNSCCGYYNSAFGYTALQNNNLGAYNTALGYSALWSSDNSSQNTAVGASAMFWTTGSNNSAVGYNAMEQNSTGGYNTAVGYQSLGGNIDASVKQTGSSNTAVGAEAMYSNQTGYENAASGVKALYFNTTGNNNIAIGYEALYLNKSGDKNTASGNQALYSNTASLNTAYGFGALYTTNTGEQNSGFGVYALRSNTTGNFNTASGVDALNNNTTGSSNIGIGYRGGLSLTTGSDNIDIGNTGVAAESGVIRIGMKSTQTAAYIAGIYGTSVTGSAVVVSSSGQLGVTVSSERFKTGIAPMGANTAKLEQLRPVTFHLKTDPQGSLQYGLIAEEVAQVYPELVIRNESGRIDGVRYDELAPMLLNEMQKKGAAQDAEIRDLRQQQVRTQQQMLELMALNRATQEELKKLQSQNASVAGR